LFTETMSFVNNTIFRHSLKLQKGSMLKFRTGW